MSKHPKLGYEMFYADASQYADLIGTTYTGRCVTSGAVFTGTVSAVVATDGNGDVRYRLSDTGSRYGNGSPVEPVVYGVARAAADCR